LCVELCQPLLIGLGAGSLRELPRHILHVGTGHAAHKQVDDECHKKEDHHRQQQAFYQIFAHLIPGFFVQLKNLCTGNFGDSWKYTVPVIQKFNEVIWVSFIMGAISLVFELLIAVPLGIVAATKQYSVTDYTVRKGPWRGRYGYSRRSALPACWCGCNAW